MACIAMFMDPQEQKYPFHYMESAIQTYLQTCKYVCNYYILFLTRIHNFDWIDYLKLHIFYVYDPIKFIAACGNKHVCMCYDSYTDVLSNIPYRNSAVLVELWEVPNNSGER